MSDQVSGPGEFRLGQRLAGYRLDELIGRGGMAVVYRAHDERLGRSVALKVLSPRYAADEGFRHRFMRESQIAASVDHPNIIPIFEAGEAGGVLFIAMRFVQGRDVLTIIDQQGPLPAARACHIVTQVAAALDAAHQRGLVHRDVKPANMLRDDAGGEDHSDHVYLSDFGLSKRSLSATRITSHGEFLGTMGYVAPEQIEGRPVDGRTDQYALACSAFEMLTGAPPFNLDETMAVMWAQVSSQPPAVTSRRPDLPGAVDQVMARALAKAPGDRYSTCGEFAAALGRACLSGGGSAPHRHEPTQAVSILRPPEPEPVVPSRPPTLVPPPQPSRPREPTAAAGPGWPAQPGGFASGAQPGGRPPRGAPHRSWRPAAIIACAVVLGAAGGAYALFGRGSSAAVTLSPPGCTASAARAKSLTDVRGHLTGIGGKPFDVVAAPGGYAFVSLGDAVAVMKTTGSSATLVRTVPLSRAQGEALTHDRKYLLVAGGSGLTVFRVSDLEQGGTTPVGALTSPGGKHAVQLAVSPDDHYAFVTLQFSARVAVFDLRRALTSGFGQDALVGLIPVGAQPVGIASSPDGRYLYVASGLATPASSSGPGRLTVIDSRKAETSPASAVIRSVGAGCGPDRVTLSADGQDVWVSVGGANAVVAYSAGKLLSDPAHALIARVPVGQLPLGLGLVKDGSRLIVADSDRDHVPGGAGGLAVLDTARALAGQPALLGFVKSGDVPRQFAVGPGGTVLLVADTGSGQLQVVKLSQLP